MNKKLKLIEDVLTRLGFSLVSEDELTSGKVQWWANDERILIVHQFQEESEIDVYAPLCEKKDAKNLAHAVEEYAKRILE